MKATLEFDCADYEESELLKKAINAGNYIAALDEISSYLRQICKYGQDDKEVEVADKIRSKFFEILTELNIQL